MSATDTPAGDRTPAIQGILPPLVPLPPLVGNDDRHRRAAARAAVAASIPRSTWPAAGR